MTAPDSEDLEKGAIYCPFCDSEFHRMQHLRSVTPASLRQLLDRAGFKVDFCDSVDLRKFESQFALPHLAKVDLAALYYWITFRALQLRDRVSPRSFPDGHTFRWARHQGKRDHLCAIATKIEAIS